MKEIGRKIEEETIEGKRPNKRERNNKRERR